MAISTFMGLETTLRGILAQQLAIDTTAHNISNASTPGYSRQSAVMAASTAFAPPSMMTPAQAGEIGTGVDVIAYQRVRDSFLDLQYRGAVDGAGPGAGHQRRPQQRAGRAQRAGRQRAQQPDAAVLVLVAGGLERPREPGDPAGAGAVRCQPRQRLQRALQPADHDPGTDRAERHRHDPEREPAGRADRHAEQLDPPGDCRRRAAERPARPARQPARPALRGSATSRSPTAPTAWSTSRSAARRWSRAPPRPRSPRAT